MHWTIAENVASAEEAIKRAAALGATLCIFPELSLTGFHRNIRAACIPYQIDAGLSRLRMACQRTAVSAAVGLPTFQAGRIFNSLAFIDPTGVCAGYVDKNGLTPTEATFFERGTRRATLPLQGARISAVICREIEDIAAVLQQLHPGQPNIVVWPGIMRPDPLGTGLGEPYVDSARTLARALKAHVVQANWPNSLNYPAEGDQQGASIVLSPDGESLLRLPRAQPGIGVFNLGDRQFDWHPE